MGIEWRRVLVVVGVALVIVTVLAERQKVQRSRVQASMIEACQARARNVTDIVYRKWSDGWRVNNTLWHMIKLYTDDIVCYGAGNDAPNYMDMLVGELCNEQNGFVVFCNTSQLTEDTERKDPRTQLSTRYFLIGVRPPLQAEGETGPGCHCSLPAPPAPEIDHFGGGAVETPK